MAFRCEDSDGLPFVFLGAWLLGLWGQGLLGNPSVLNPGVSLRLPRTLVRQCEDLSDDLDVVCLLLTHHLLVGDPFAKRHNDDDRQDAWNGVPHLVETLNELPR